jgi:two-component system, sensor histidine kinase and response regulator
VSKLEEGKLLLDRQPVEVGGLAEQVKDDLKVQAEARRMRLVVDRPAAPLELAVDPGLLRRALENLVSNAIKFSPPGSEVVVRVAPRGGPDGRAGARLAVADEGPGVPEEARGRLFEKFAITDLKRSGVRQTGLGLYLVRLVAEAHGGTVAIEPNQPRGSVFSITL